MNWPRFRTTNSANATIGSFFKSALPVPLPLHDSPFELSAPKEQEICDSIELILILARPKSAAPQE